MKQFKLIPILGLRTYVSADDHSMLQMVNNGVALSHAAGGQNFSLKRKLNACTKSLGQAQKSNSANASATLCMGMFELYDGTNRNYLFFDNGLLYKYDSSWDPSEITVATPVTFANDSGDLYSIIRIGAYVVWADRAEHTPYKWKHGDANSSKLIASGTEYKFRYLTSFQRRVIGLYSDQTDGNIDIRWSTAWPTTAITSLNFPAANQLWVPNDDPIVGVGLLGRDKCYPFCENSIQQLVYYPDYTAPFRCFTVVSDQGCGGHHSIINANGQLYFFNPNFGFCSYAGGNAVIPISDDILPELRTIDRSYFSKIVGKHIPYHRQIIWTVPFDGESECNHIVIFNYDTNQWEIETKSTRWIDDWFIYTSLTWAQLETLVGGTGIWTDAGTATWQAYLSVNTLPVFGGTDGHFYTHTTEADKGSDINGFREEPILYFGNKRTYKDLLEIWFDVVEKGDFAIDVYHRGGNTAGEVEASAYELVGTLSMSSPPSGQYKVNINKNMRMHQIKWGSDLQNEKFMVNGIVFKYTESSEV